MRTAASCSEVLGQLFDRLTRLQSARAGMDVHALPLRHAWAEPPIDRRPSRLKRPERQIDCAHALPTVRAAWRHCERLERLAGFRAELIGPLPSKCQSDIAARDELPEGP